MGNGSDGTKNAISYSKTLRLASKPNEGCMDFVLPPLPFALDALEPYIDKETMKVHHDGHHKAYVKKLNEAFDECPELKEPIEDLLISLDRLPGELAKEVQNNGGGHANHTLFWSILTPNALKKPEGELADVIGTQFDSFRNFKEKFTEVAVEHFASGWAWLCTDTAGKLSVCSTKDQTTPLSDGKTPLLTLDLWEHAYYLKYKNKRPEFVEAFWSVVDWEEVAARWEEFKNTGCSVREWNLVKGRDKKKAA